MYQEISAGYTGPAVSQHSAVGRGGPADWLNCCNLYMVTRSSPGQGSNVSPGSTWPRKYRAELCETRPPADYKLAVRPRPCPVSRESGLRINQVSFRSQPTDQLDHPTKYSAYEGPTKQRSAVVLRLRLEAGVR